MIRIEQWDKNISELVFIEFSVCARNCTKCLIVYNPIKNYH